MSSYLSQGENRVVLTCVCTWLPLRHVSSTYRNVKRGWFQYVSLPGFPLSCLSTYHKMRRG